MAVDIAYLGRDEDPSNASEYTFSSESIGSAAADRQVLVAIWSRSGDSADSLSGVTIGGVTATIDQSTKATGDGFCGISAIARAAVPTGTTATVVVTFSATMVRCVIARYRMVGADTGAASDTLGDTSDDPTGTINIPAGGGLIAGVCNSGGSSVAWTGPTEDVEDTEETMVYSAAHDEYASEQTNYTVTANYNSPVSGSSALAAVAYAPAASGLLIPVAMHHYRRMQGSR